MLIQFSVKNFLSFKNEQVFTTLATSDKSLEETNLIKFRNKRYSKVNIFYGANASGKTNVMCVFAFVKWFMYNSSRLYDNSETTVVPFEFDEKCKKSPSEFNFIFVVDGIKYSYSFACTAHEVVSERLDVYESGKPKLVFDRDHGQYKFNAYASELNPIVQRNAKNKLFVCTLATWNVDLVKPVVNFFINDIMVEYFDSPSSVSSSIERYQKDGIFDKYKNFCIKLLTKSDFSIDNFDMEVEEVTIPQSSDPLSASAPIKKRKYYTFFTYHKIKRGEEYDSIPLNLERESLGTQAIFKLTPTLFDVLRNGGVLLMDEIDSSLHPLLVRFIIGLFTNPETNPKGAQLICNAHDVTLLSSDLFRRDEVWFVDRDPEKGDSTIFPLSDFSPLKSDNMERNYMLGRYGAIPYIKEVSGLWD